MADLNKESMAIWKSLKPMIDEEIKAQTRGSVQRRKMKVTTAPSLVTNVIGVTEPYGTEMLIPFNTNLSAAHIGDVVWVEFMYGATNAFASMYASADTKDWTVGGNANIIGNATINGVLDVTNRRCEATLSSVGWYRAIIYNAYDNYSALGYSGEIITIRAVYTSAVSCQHTIKLFMSYNKIVFLGEETSGTTNVLDKIRYTVNGSKGYVDIHWTSTTACQVNVSFEVASRNYAQANWVAGTLASVADAPSGETVLTEYSFGTNGVYTNTDLTVNGTFDVVPRRCSATLSSVGWYRVLSFETNETFQRGSYPFVIDLCIRRAYNATDNELHKVSLLVAYNNAVFGDEVSLSKLFYIRGIRYTISSTKSYIDIRYSLSQSNNVSVDFTVHALPSMCHGIKAESLQSVADAPSGETVLASYVPAQNCIPESKWLLWTNSSPASEFAAQTVSVDLSRYNFVEIESSPFAGDDRVIQKFPVGKNGHLFFMYLNADTATDAAHMLNGVSRSVSVTTSGVTFGNGMMVYSGGSYTNWAIRAIPTRIWGIK